EAGRPAYLLGISEDVTERRELEEQRRQGQKLEAIGTLAGGLAHDFNNILACVIAFAELVRLDCPADDPTRVNVDSLLEAGHRGKRLVEQLLAFSRQTAPARGAVDPGAVVASTLQLVRPTLPPGVTVQLDAAPGLPHILADATQLHQTLANLVANAAHALG